MTRRFEMSFALPPVNMEPDIRGMVRRKMVRTRTPRTSGSMLIGGWVIGLVDTNPPNDGGRVP